ncbi:MAG: dihydrofolate reductase family protein [Rhodothermales bacterium]
MPLPQLSVFLGLSLDGFIAREDGSLDWLMAFDRDDTDYGYADFFATIDTVVLGRRTFETVVGFGVDAWPYTEKRVIVLSSGAPGIPPTLQANVEVLALEPLALAEHLGATGSKHVYLDGGQTVQRFLRDGLPLHLTLTYLPILIGYGRRLFGPLAEDRSLDLLDSTSFTGDAVQLRYRVLSNSD